MSSLDWGGRDPAEGEGIININDIMLKDVFPLSSFRTPAMIGCSFVVDREYFGQIGLLDPGMEVYGGENIELGMRVRRLIILVIFKKNTVKKPINVTTFCTHF